MSPPLPHLVAAGRRLEYRWIPAARLDAPTLVFLHEGLGSVALWGDFPDRLAAATGIGRADLFPLRLRPVRPAARAADARLPRARGARRAARGARETAGSSVPCSSATAMVPPSHSSTRRPAAGRCAGSCWRRRTSSSKTSPSGASSAPAPTTIPGASAGSSSPGMRTWTRPSAAGPTSGSCRGFGRGTSSGSCPASTVPCSSSRARRIGMGPRRNSRRSSGERVVRWRR
jgi:hypothetical protein